MTKQETVGGAERRGALGRATYNLVSKLRYRRTTREETQFKQTRREEAAVQKLKIGELGHRFVQDGAVKK